jgi:anti-sigma regulatory factor (Ser/Thr protein kinase)
MEVTLPVEATQWTTPVADPSRVYELRRRAASLARAAGLDETASGALALIVTEAGNNLARHATQGEMLLRLVREPGRAGVEVLAVDRGPGIKDVAQSLRDGYSTVGTPGTGMGAIRRQSAEFDIHSLPGRGTALVSRVWTTEPAAALPKLGAVCLPVGSEEVPGDAWDASDSPTGLRFLVVDGVGHGPDAAQAAARVVKVFRAGLDQTLPTLLEWMHDALRALRGAVVAIAEVDRAQSLLRFVGVGNVAASLWGGPRPQNLVSMNGTLGHGAFHARLFTYPLSGQTLLVMHSDGLATRWNLEDYAGLLARDPAIVAGVLYRDYTRGRDDVTVLAASLEPRRP